MTARTIAIGDIHGCARALEALLEAVRPTANDQLIFLGDYVDRGPDSRRVIDILLELERATQVSFLLEIINHAGAGTRRGADPWLSARRTADGRQLWWNTRQLSGNREFLAQLLRTTNRIRISLCTPTTSPSFQWISSPRRCCSGCI